MYLSFVHHGENLSTISLDCLKYRLSEEMSKAIKKPNVQRIIKEKAIPIAIKTFDTDLFLFILVTNKSKIYEQIPKNQIGTA